MTILTLLKDQISTFTETKPAEREGLRAVNTAPDDEYVVCVLVQSKWQWQSPDSTQAQCKGQSPSGLQAFAEACSLFPKVFAQNSGFDLQETLKF
jgi:T-complex protein 1 subunit zeta